MLKTFTICLLHAVALAESEPIIEELTMDEPMPELFPEPMPILEPLPPIIFPPIEHSCAPLREPCNYETHYYNYLACGCFAQYWCEIGCLDGGRVDPRETCGECMSETEIRALYPQTATDDDIANAERQGLMNAQNRPDDWRICPREDHFASCELDQYFNELACECFAAAKCKMLCPPGLELDPAKMCGDCLTQDQIRGKYYPEWADPQDISLAQIDGLAYLWDMTTAWKVCPYVENIWQCEQGMYWNELACQCFHMAACFLGCPEGQELTPLSMCECVDSEKLKGELYPEWATDAQIQKARDAGFDNYQNRDRDRFSCNSSSRECQNGFYFNELSCNCFSKAQCFAPCESGVNNPLEHCGCFDTEEEYLALFPTWANYDDIKKSVEEGWSRNDMPPPDLDDDDVDVERPENWPDCGRRERCDSAQAFNELACMCLALEILDLECKPGYIVSPVVGNECILEEKIGSYWPDWATEEDIILSHDLSFRQWELDQERQETEDASRDHFHDSDGKDHNDHGGRDHGDRDHDDDGVVVDIQAIFEMDGSVETFAVGASVLGGIFMAMQ